MKIVQKSWGCEIWWAHTPSYMGKTLIINPDNCTSLHYHKYKDETILVRRGTLVVCASPETHLEPILVKEGQTIYLPPGKSHRLCVGEQGAELIEVSTSYPDDSVRVKE